MLVLECANLKAMTDTLINIREKYPQIVYSKQSDKPLAPSYKGLVFDSKFESGNLNYVIKVTDYHYLLFLQYDQNSIGHTQWFYFRVKSTLPASKNARFEFDIVNMVFIT